MTLGHLAPDSQACSELGHDICEAHRAVTGACSIKISSRTEGVMPLPLLGGKFLARVGGRVWFSVSLRPPPGSQSQLSCAQPQ